MTEFAPQVVEEPAAAWCLEETEEPSGEGVVVLERQEPRSGANDVPVPVTANGDVMCRLRHEASVTWGMAEVGKRPVAIK